MDRKVIVSTTSFVATPSSSMTVVTSSLSSVGRPRTLMESLLAKKMEMVGVIGSNMHPDRRLLRTDSLDSTSSFGSLSSSLAYAEDVCRCDDCLLGIADLYTISETESALAKKKVNQLKWNFIHTFSGCSFIIVCTLWCRTSSLRLISIV